MCIYICYNRFVQIAGVRSQAGPYHGVQSWIYGFDLKTEKDQAAFSQVYVADTVNNKINYISAGFMVGLTFIVYFFP